MTSLYEQCSIETGGYDSADVLQCVADRLEEIGKVAQSSEDDGLVSWLLVLGGALVFFMQAGFAMLCAGCVRKKNVQNTMLKNILDACGAAIAFFSVGFAIAFGGQNDTADITFIGTKNFFNTGEVDQGFWFFQFAFSATAVTIVAGTLAERCQMAAYLCYSVFLTGFVYPVVAHTIWSNNGFLSAFSATPFNDIGVIDFAGSGVVHLTGGATALIATYILGARKGRFHDSRGRPLDKPQDIIGHSIALQVMGTMVLWFGWYGFNPGSALLLTAPSSTGKVAALSAVNTSLAAAAGAITALFTNLYMQERKSGEYKFDITKTMNGLLGALVAVTACAATIENWAACVVGMVAAWFYLGGSYFLVSVRLDDAVDAIPVHMVNGAWGLVATGLFSSPRKVLDAFGSDAHAGFFYTIGNGDLDGKLLLNQIAAVAFILGWVLFTMLPFFLWLNYMGWLRADSLEELVGLDLAYMGNEQSILNTGDDFSSHGGPEFGGPTNAKGASTVFDSGSNDAGGSNDDE